MPRNDDFEDFFSENNLNGSFGNNSSANFLDDSSSDDGFWSDISTESSNHSTDVTPLEDADEDLLGEDDDSFWGGNTEESSVEEDDELLRNNGSTQSGDERERSLKKIAIFALGLAAMLIIIVCIITRIVGNSKKAEQNINYTVEETKISYKETQMNNSNTNKTVNKTANKSNNWIEVEHNTFGTIDTQIESIFTVTGVNTYAKTLNNGEFQIKTEAIGNIAGLTGTYTVNIPFNLTGVVSIGQQLEVIYSIGEKNGSKIVGDINLK